MSEMSSSEKPEFCFPSRRGSRTFCVAEEGEKEGGVVSGRNQAGSRSHGKRGTVGL